MRQKQVEWAATQERQLNEDEEVQAEAEARAEAKQQKEDEERDEMKNRLAQLETMLKQLTEKKHRSRSAPKQKDRPHVRVKVPATTPDRPEPPPEPEKADAIESPKSPDPVPPPPGPGSPTLEEIAPPKAPPKEYSAAWGEQEYVPPPAVARAVAGDAEAGDDDEEDSDVQLLGVVPAPAPVEHIEVDDLIQLVLRRLTAAEKMAKLLEEREKRDYEKELSTLRMCELEQALYGEEQSVMIDQIMTIYEHRPRGLPDDVTLRLAIQQLGQACPYLLLFEARCRVFGGLSWVWLFARLLRKVLLYNRKRDLIMDLDEVFAFLSYCL
jgi:hypothetical protein